jgi:flagellar protein FlaG
VQRPQPTAPAPRTPKTGFSDHLDPATAELPPPEVQAEVQAALRAANRLHDLGRQVRFSPAEDGGRIGVEIRDLDGNLLRQIPVGEVFELAVGNRVD